MIKANGTRNPTRKWIATLAIILLFLRQRFSWTLFRLPEVTFHSEDELMKSQRSGYCKLNARDRIHMTRITKEARRGELWFWDHTEQAMEIQWLALMTVRRKTLVNMLSEVTVMVNLYIMLPKGQRKPKAMQITLKGRKQVKMKSAMAMLRNHIGVTVFFTWKPVMMMIQPFPTMPKRKARL